MKAFVGWQPPTPAELQAAKATAGLTAEQLATVLGLADGRQARKYLGGRRPRRMGPAMVFVLAAQLELSATDVDRVRARMRAMGAQFAD